MLIKNIIACPWNCFHIYACVQDETISAHCPHATLWPWSVEYLEALEYFINKMDPVYSSFYVRHSWNGGSIVQRRCKNIICAPSILHCTTQMPFLSLNSSRNSALLILHLGSGRL